MVIFMLSNVDVVSLISFFHLSVLPYQMKTVVLKKNHPSIVFNLIAFRLNKCWLIDLHWILFQKSCQTLIVSEMWMKSKNIIFSLFHFFHLIFSPFLLSTTSLHLQSHFLYSMPHFSFSNFCPRLLSFFSPWIYVRISSSLLMFSHNRLDHASPK